MFNIGDKILYGTTGICKVSAIEEKIFAGTRKKYYILQALFQSESTVFVPIDNDALTSKMHFILSREELLCEIEKARDLRDALKESEQARQEDFDTIIRDGDRARLIRLIFLLYAHRDAQIESGKRLHISDSKILKSAEKIIYEEIAFNLGGSLQDAAEFLAIRMEKSV